MWKYKNVRLYRKYLYDTIFHLVIFHLYECEKNDEIHSNEIEHIENEFSKRQKQVKYYYLKIPCCIKSSCTYSLIYFHFFKYVSNRMTKMIKFSR